MIRISKMAALAGLATLAFSGPAAADSNHSRSAYDKAPRGWQADRHGDAVRHSYRREQQRDRYVDRRNDRWDDRRDDRRAYAAGYRDGNRNDGYGQRPYYGGGNGGPYVYGAGYAPQAAYRGGQYWYGPNGRINCRRSDGTTGVVVGALAGGTLGNILAQTGDKTIGSLIGGTLGAILGQELARGNGSCR